MIGPHSVRGDQARSYLWSGDGRPSRSIPNCLMIGRRGVDDVRSLPLLCADVENPLCEERGFGDEVVGVAVDEIEFIFAAQVV